MGAAEALLGTERRNGDRRNDERRAREGRRRRRDATAAALDAAMRRSGRLVRENRTTVSLGLAASSLALLAGAGAGPATGTAATGNAAADEGEVAAEKAVTWDIEYTEHDRVDFFVEYLMGKNYDRTHEWLERVGKYGPMIANELRARDMPQDLLYLGMIESGLDPNAYSRAHAAGLWQFIEETGQRYGLEVSSYVDERRDPMKATGAALTYLQEMHDDFDSWYLSAAGYNTGENRVARLLKERGGSLGGDEALYWEIWHELPSETRDYVPLMLAMGKIAKEPAKYGFTDIQPQAPLRFDQVVVPGGTSLDDLAASTGLDAEVLYDLNPHLVRKQTPPDRRMPVRVPLGEGTRVAANVDGGVEMGFWSAE